MKKFLFAFLLTISFCDVSATHLIGGEMRYEYIGPGAAPNSKQYRIRLLLFRGPGGALFIGQYIVGVFNNDNGSKVPGTAANSNWAAIEDFVNPRPVPITISPCIQNAPILDYTYKTYSFLIELPENNTGYTIAFQTFSRQNSNNINNNQGANYTCIVPGKNVFPVAYTDNSPAFKLPVSVICENSSFELDFSAVDPDPTDSLVYGFCNAYDGGAATLADFQNPAPPPYASVIYTGGFTAASPLGNRATINRFTGVISGIAPAAGKYVVCVCISVYRNGTFITTHRKDLIVEVSNCTVANADLDPSYITCDGFSMTFNTLSTGNTFSWNFGDPASGANNTSTLQNPSHTYTDTGIFRLIVIASIGGQCASTDTSYVSVYPGFFPGFLESQPQCINVPVQFTDTTRTNYGLVDTWRWDFGDPGTLADTSHFQNPDYTYSTTGTYNVTLIVTNSKGCLKTITKQVTVNPPPPINMLFRDSTYCGLDSIQLVANGTGNFTWTPNSFIINANTATPTVFPPASAKYYVTLNANGCISKDSVTVTPVNDLNTTAAANPANICEEDTTVLSATSNHSPITWQWNNTATLANPNAQTTQAFPIVNTTYTVTARWGNHCVATASRAITVKPLAIPNAGPDRFICVGQNTAQLNASGGNTYSWTPVAGLSNPNIANPVANPADTTTYIVAVGVTGCTKTRLDSMIVFVNDLPALAVTNDTLICTIDTLQLTGTGTGNFVWSPGYMINNVNNQNPLVSPDVPTKYYVTLTDAAGCYSKDSVFVNVKPFVTLNAGPDTSVCRTDAFPINTASDGLHFVWTPSTYLDDPTKKNPIVTPLTNGLLSYHVIANIGKCQSQDDINIRVAPYPIPDAGADTAICPGDNTQLSAGGGSIYIWSPPTFLSNRFIPNPQVLQPTASIRYIVNVSDTLGCPKQLKDTVFVTVYPKVIADAGPRDTSIVEGQPLLLTGTGGTTYLWSPAQWLTSTVTPTTVSTPLNTIEYYLLVKSTAGCEGRDSILVKVFKVESSIYVPTAFSPNGDGLNDVLRPILLGMKQLTYFKVFNRWGQMVFSTSDPGQGWDGKIGGRGQDAATFVWEAEGVTYKNITIKKKGYAVLVR